MKFFHHKSSIGAIKKFNPKGSYQGPETVKQKGTKVAEKVFELIPILGICYGMKAMANQLGGKVELANKREFGHADLKLRNQAAGLFENI